MRYTYLGDRHTEPDYINMQCDPVRRADGKCIVGASKMLVEDAAGRRHVVLRRRLRVNSKKDARASF